MGLARAYVVAMHFAEDSSVTSLLENPYYFCECTGDNEPSWKEIATVISSGLHQAGRIQNLIPNTLSEDLYDDVFGPYTSAVMGLNSLSRVIRLRELGWKSAEKNWRKIYLEDELLDILKEETGSFAGYKDAVAS